MTRQEIVLRHFKKRKGLTSWEAFDQYGITRLSAVIFELRKIYDFAERWVEKTNRYGEDVRFKQYILKGKKHEK